MKSGDLFERSYRIVEELGRGAHATVYLGEHVEIGQRVAIKVMHVESARFTREGRVLAALKSPHTVRLLAFGRTEDDEQYLISEWVDGESLKDYLKRVRSVSAEQMVHIVKQVLESLAEAHAQHIVHRDIKPGNIMVADETSVKLLDFGIAKGKDDFDVTNAGEFVGTPRYIAPEIFRGEDATPAVDVFGVGLIMYALVTGEPANKGKGLEAILTQHLVPDPYLLPDDAPVSPALRSLINRMISKDPSTRPGDAGEVLRALEVTQSGSDQSGRDSLMVPAPAPEALRELEQTPMPSAVLPVPTHDATIEDTSLSELMAETPGMEEETSEPSFGHSVAPQDEVQPAVVRPVSGQFSAPEPTEPAPPAAPKQNPPWLAVGIVVLLLAVAGMLIARSGAVEPESTDTNTTADNRGAAAADEAADDPETRKLLTEGTAHYKAKRYVDALRAFRTLEDGPDSAAKSELAESGLRERAMDELLFDAVSSTENASTQGEFTEAMVAPKKALTIYPDHPRLKELIERLHKSAEDIAKGRTH